MAEHLTDDPADQGRPPTVADPDRPDLEATVVHHDDGHAECTIYPVDADETELVTTWITADEGAFVSLEAMR